MNKPEYSVLFVCMGNICRSPTAEAVFRHQIAEAGLQDRVGVDSAGTHNFHPGEPPDWRSQQHAARRGYDLSTQRARPLRPLDYTVFDLIVVMDWENLAQVQADCPPAHHGKIRRLMAYCAQAPDEVVPDPYAGGTQGFETVLDYVELACAALLQDLSRRLSVSGRSGRQGAVRD
jgi:protein-tyrosine phosphatase